MQTRNLESAMAQHLARGVIAVALAFAAAGAMAQGRDSPIIARELEPLPTVTVPANGISGRTPGHSARSSAIDRNEANRRLLQAQREFARGPDMQQGIPPSAEKVRGDRRRARVISLQRSVDAAQARAREVNGHEVSAEASGRMVPVSLAHVEGQRIQ